MTETIQEESLTTISEHDGRNVYEPPPEIIEQANITSYMRQKRFKSFEQLYQWLDR